VVNNISKLKPYVTRAEMRNFELKTEQTVSNFGNSTSTTVNAAFASRSFVIVDIPLTRNSGGDLWKIQECVGLYVESVLLNHYHGVIKGPINFLILVDSVKGCPVLHDFNKYLQVTLDKHTSIGMVMKNELYSPPVIEVSVCTHIISCYFNFVIQTNVTFFT